MATYLAKYITINNYKVDKFTINGVKYSFGKELVGYLLINNITWNGNIYTYDYGQNDETVPNVTPGTNPNNPSVTPQLPSITPNNPSVEVSPFNDSAPDISTSGIHLFDGNMQILYNLQYCKLSSITEVPSNWKPIDIYLAFQIGDIVAVKCNVYSPCTITGWVGFSGTSEIQTLQITELIQRLSIEYKPGIYMYQVSPKVSSTYNYLLNRGPYTITTAVTPKGAGIIKAKTNFSVSLYIQPVSEGVWSINDHLHICPIAYPDRGYDIDHWELYFDEPLFRKVNDEWKVVRHLDVEPKNGAFYMYELEYTHCDLKLRAVFKVANSNLVEESSEFSNLYMGTVSIFDLTPHLYYSIDDCNTWFPIKYNGYYNNSIVLVGSYTYENKKYSKLYFKMVYTYKNSTNFDISEPYYEFLRTVPTPCSMEDMYENWTASGDLMTTYEGYKVNEYWHIWIPNFNRFTDTTTELEFYNNADSMLYRKSVPGHEYIWPVFSNAYNDSSYRWWGGVSFTEAYALIKKTSDNRLIDNLNGDHATSKDWYLPNKFPAYDDNDSYEPSAYFDSKMINLMFNQPNAFKFWQFDSIRNNYENLVDKDRDIWINAGIMAKGFTKYTITGGSLKGIRKGKYDLDFTPLMDLSDTDHFITIDSGYDKDPAKYDPRQWYWYSCNNITNPEKEYRMSLAISLFGARYRISNYDSYPKLTLRTKLHSNEVEDVTNPYIVKPTKAVLLNIYNPGEILWQTESIHDFTIECPNGITIEKNSEGFVIPIETQYNGLYKIKCTHGEYSSEYPFIVDA